MTRATWMKFFAGVLLFGTWLGLVLARLTPAPALIDAIGYALVGLGIYHATAAGGDFVLKFLAGLMLFGAWLALVCRGFAPAAGLIDAIAYTLAGLGVYQAKGVLPLAARYGVVPGGLIGGAVAGATVAAVAGASATPDSNAAAMGSTVPAVAATPVGVSSTVQVDLAPGVVVQPVAQPAPVQ